MWSALVSGFGGFRDHNGRFTFDPRLPDGWERLTFRLTIRGTRIRVTLTVDRITFTVEAGEPDAEVQLSVRGEEVRVNAAAPVSVALEGQGPRRVGVPTMRDVAGTRRADGTLLTASIPTLSIDVDDEDAASVYG